MGHYRAAATVNLSCAFLVAIALGVTGNGATAQSPIPEPPAPATPAPPGPDPAKPAPATPAPSPPAAAPPAQPQTTPQVKALTDQEIEGVLGKEVVSTTNENMGRVVEVLVDHTGKVGAAIIDFGGFLGVGSRKIAVDWSALHFTSTRQARHAHHARVRPRSGEGRTRISGWQAGGGPQRAGHKCLGRVRPK
jgi:PRC-barrel domain